MKISRKVRFLDWCNEYVKTHADRDLSTALVTHTVNVDFEHYVIDTIVNRVKTDKWGRMSQFDWLRMFIQNGGRMEDLDYFYEHIQDVGLWRGGRGYDLTYIYCRNVLRGRLPEDIELKLFSDGNGWSRYGSSFCYKYAKYVVRGRLPAEYEKKCNSEMYVEFLLKKGEDVSDLLINSTSMAYYFYHRHGYLPDTVHNFMIGSHLAGDRDNYVVRYFKRRKKDDYAIYNRLKNMDSSKTVGEILLEFK